MAEHVERLSGLPRSLSLLRHIEYTLDVLRLSHDFVDLVSSIIKDEIHKIATSGSKEKLDKDGKLAGKLLTTQQALKSYHAQLKLRCDSAQRDSNLNSEDGIVDAYCSYIEAVAEVHNDINTLRFEIAAHDAKFSKVVGKFNSADDLTRFLIAKCS